MGKVFIAASSLLATFFVVVTPAKSAGPCDSVLRDGTFSSLNIRSNKYERMVVAARLAQTTKKQAESNLGASANFPIDGIPIGANYTDREFNEWAQSVRSSLDVNQISQKEIQILASSGDPVIVDAWKSCMRNRGGLAVSFNETDEENIIMSLEYNPFPGSNRDSLLVNGNILGAKVVDSKTGKLALSLARGVNEEIILQRESNKKPVLAVFRSKVGSADAYLPAIKEIQPIRFLYRTRTEVTPPTGVGAHEGEPLMSGQWAAPISIRLNPGEQPENMSDLISNVSLVSSSVVDYGNNPKGNIISIYGASWDANSSTLFVNWNTGIVNGHNNMSYYKLTATVTVRYRMPNPDAVSLR